MNKWDAKMQSYQKFLNDGISTRMEKYSVIKVSGRNS